MEHLKVGWKYNARLIYLNRITKIESMIHHKENMEIASKKYHSIGI